jgi:hypothetical protein
MAVLSEGALAKQIEPGLHETQARLLMARQALDRAQHLKDGRAIDNLVAAAVRSLRAARSSLADPATLPPSFRQ